MHVPGRPYPEEGVAWPLEKEPLEARNTWIDSKYANLPPVAARYATSITRLDDAIGDLVRHLKRHGLDRDTLQPIHGTGTLRMDDVSDFMKRLRSRLGVRDIRFYGAGEYSPVKRRPHYHLILFADLDDVRQAKPTDGGAVFLPRGSGWSETIESCWGHGLTDCSPAGSYAMSYVAGYVTKKFKGKQEDDYQDQVHQFRRMFPEISEQPIEEARMSRRPGIGVPWIEAHPDLCLSGRVAVPTNDGARWAPLPRIAEAHLPKETVYNYKEKNHNRALDAMQQRIKMLDGRRTLFSQAEIDEYIELSKPRRSRSASFL